MEFNIRCVPKLSRGADISNDRCFVQSKHSWIFLDHNELNMFVTSR